MEKTEQLNDQLKDKNKIDRQLSAAIMCAVEMETTMKLYSYRVISPEDFIQRVTDLTNALNYSNGK